MVGVSASVNLPLHHKVQKFSSGTGSPGWPRKRAVKRLWCVVYYNLWPCLLLIANATDWANNIHLQLNNVRQLHGAVETSLHSHTSRWVHLMLCAGWHASTTVQTVLRPWTGQVWTGRYVSTGRKQAEWKVMLWSTAQQHTATQHDRHWRTYGWQTFIWMKSIKSRTVDAVCPNHGLHYRI